MDAELKNALRDLQNELKEVRKKVSDLERGIVRIKEEQPSWVEKAFGFGSQAAAIAMLTEILDIVKKEAHRRG